MKAWRAIVVCVCVGLFVGEAAGQKRFADLVAAMRNQFGGHSVKRDEADDATG